MFTSWDEKRPYVIGVDGGGTKTLAVAATLSGEVIAVERSGPANYQTVGPAAAMANISRALAGVSEATGAPTGCSALHLALAGADRPRDLEVLGRFLPSIIPSPPWPRWSIDNDVIAALATGSEDGIGVALICGTGTNCVGVGPDGSRVQIGGLGRAFGDAAGGWEIGVRAMSAAVRGEDGRGRPTLLSQMIRDHLGVADLLCIADDTHAASGSFAFSTLVPVVFSAAEYGDEVAREILRDNGRELGISALAALRRLFPPDAQVAVILCGGVAKNPNRIIRDAVAEVVLLEFPKARIVVPSAEPVLGAVVNAARLAGAHVERELIEKLEASYSRYTDGSGCT
ncbi:MAG: hypothetical protein NUW23_12550 [Firmicutes bacterium]|jgi:N-acetylglucosamine kinase-like BadF-type ATPase|nr:hypothetical protein [Bacillota bacterium]